MNDSITRGVEPAIGSRSRVGSARGLRLTLGTAMIGVVAAASLCAFAAELMKIVPPEHRLNVAISGAAVVALFGSAIGLALRRRLAEILWQVSLASGVLAMMAFGMQSEVSGGLILNYTFLSAVGLLLVLPTAIVRRSTMPPSRGGFVSGPRFSLASAMRRA